MSEQQKEQENFLIPLLGTKIVCPKCFRPTLEVISVNGTPLVCKKPEGCGKRMTIKEYVEIATKELSFSWFQEVFPSVFKRVQRWD